MPLDPIPFLLLCGWLIGAVACAAASLRWLMVAPSSATFSQALLLVAGGALTYFFYAWFLAFRQEVNSWASPLVVTNFALGILGAVCIGAAMVWRRMSNR